MALLVSFIGSCGLALGACAATLVYDLTGGQLWTTLLGGILPLLVIFTAIGVGLLAEELLP